MRRLRLFVAVVGLFATSLSPAPAQAEDPIRIGNTHAQIYCNNLYYPDPNRPGEVIDIDNTDCDTNWSIDIVNGPSWTFDETRERSGSAGGHEYAMKVSQKAGYDLSVDSAGNMTALHVHAAFATTATHAGELDNELSLALPFTTGADKVHVTGAFGATATGKGASYADAVAHWTVSCGSGPPVGFEANVEGHVESRWEEGDLSTEGDPSVDADLVAGKGFCRLDLSFEATAETEYGNFIQEKEQASASVTFDLTVTAAPTKCDLAGTVRDGDPDVDLHANPLRGIPVELYAGGKATGIRAVTGADGKYCLHGVEKKAYELRAELSDAAHDPSIFRTLHGSSSSAESASRPVAETDLGEDEFDLDFTKTTDKPWLADVAAIHYEATRFVDWLISSGVATAAELDKFTILTGSSHGTAYDVALRLLYLQESDTPYAQRLAAWSECPENCEWHEIGHHVGHRLKVAATESPQCVRQVNHGGWLNSSTCDSLSEGFASFLSTLGSLTIDNGRGTEYATPDYSLFGNLDDDSFFPWVMVGTKGGIVGKEEFAVSQLLWDLIDDTPNEQSLVPIVDPLRSVVSPDGIAIDAASLVRLMAREQVVTVTDIHDALVSSDLVSASDKQPSVDLNADGTADVSALDAIFLVHGFHPLHDANVPWYVVGDPVSTTDRAPIDQTTGTPLSSASGVPLTFREHVERTAGAAITFTNGTGASVDYHIDVTYPATASHWTVSVGPNSTVTVPIELPTYWTGVVDPTAGLPACGGENQRLVTLALSGGELEDKKLTNCEYLHAVTAATGDSALSFGTPVSTPTSPPAPAGGSGGSPVVMLGVAIIAIAAVGLIAFGFAKRRRPS